MVRPANLLVTQPWQHTLQLLKMLKFEEKSRIHLTFDNYVALSLEEQT